MSTYRCFRLPKLAVLAAPVACLGAVLGLVGSAWADEQPSQRPAGRVEAGSASIERLAELVAASRGPERAAHLAQLKERLVADPSQASLLTCEQLLEVATQWRSASGAGPAEAEGAAGQAALAAVVERWVQSLDARGGWDALTDRELAELLALVSRIQAEPMEGARTRITQVARERLDRDAAVWIEGTRLQLLAALIPHLGDPEKSEFRLRLVNQASGDRIATLELNNLQGLRNVGRMLGVDEGVLADWPRRWFAGDRWRSEGPASLASVLRGIGEYTEAAAVEDASRRVVEHACARMGQDDAWLADALQTRLLRELLARASAEGKARIGEVLGDRVGGSPAVVAGLSFEEVERLRATLVTLGRRDAVAPLLSGWVLTGDTWRGGSAADLGGLLELMLDPGGVDALARARLRVVDRVLAQGQEEPAWLSESRDPQFARLIWAVVASLRHDHDRSSDDAVLAAVAPVLNAQPPLAPVEEVCRFRVDWSATFQRAWYTSYGSLSAVESEGLADLLHRGLVTGELRPTLPVLFILAWHDKARGDLPIWQAYCEDRVESSAGSDRIVWLIARAYAEEVSTQPPAALGGKPWLDRALAEAVSPPDVLAVSKLLYVQHLGAERFAEAASLHESLMSRFAGQAEEAQWSAVSKLAHLYEASAERAVRAESQRVEASRRQGLVAMLERRLAEYEAQGRSAEDVASLREVLESERAGR